jgi:anti-sigma factor RsiW
MKSAPGPHARFRKSFGRKCLPRRRIRPPANPARGHAPGARQARDAASPARTCREDGRTLHRALGYPHGPVLAGHGGIGRLRGGLGSASTWLALRASVQDTNLADTLIADHKRGLLSGQPFDVASSDRHTVKPWFATRFALAPKVVDLAPQGFPLAGGRIDVIAGAPAPVLTYRHNEHFISLTALPAQTASAPQALVIEGYSVQVWRDGGTDYWAISDIDPAELSKFRQLFEAAAKAGSEKNG